MQKGKFLYEGKAKQLFTTDRPDVLWLEFKDDATAFNGEKREVFPGKGLLNNKISAAFFDRLTAAGVLHHYLGPAGETGQLVRSVKILPLELVVRAAAAGGICRRLGLTEGQTIPGPLIEWYFKQDALGDPLVTEEHIAFLNLASPGQLTYMKNQAHKIFKILDSFLRPRGILLVDFKLEFGVDNRGQLLLADEISPDTCRFWDAASGDKLDKDRFRNNLGGVIAGYQKIWNIVGGSA